MKKQSKPKVLIVLICALIFSACERTQFRQVAEATAPIEEPLKLPDPTPVIEPEPLPPIDPPVVVEPPPPPPPAVEPPPPTPPPVIAEPPPPPPVVVEPPPPPPPPVIVEPPPVQKSGVCANDSSTQLLSCMKCVVPMNPPVPPQFSEKGQSFIDVMAIGCSVPNKSAPKNYVPPTKEQLIARLSRLSPTFYPDSQMSTQQKNVINGLKNDPALQKKMFGGLWYQPPYSDAFETYFGASVSELVYQICYQSPESNFTPNENSPLQSKEYWDCLHSDNSFHCKEKPDYVKANVYRTQLRQAMNESINNPYVAPPLTPAKKCNWESFEGNYEQGADAVLAKWLVSGYKIGIEIGSLAGKCEFVNSLPTGSATPRGPVKMSAFICK